MEECFKPFSLAPQYEISNFGRVRRNTGSGYKSLAGSVDRDGYRCFTLYIDGVPRSMKAHSLVLVTFKGPRPIGAVGRHLDGDSSNNRISNLAWGSHRQNWQDKREHGRATAGERNGRHRLTDMLVQMLRLEYGWAARGSKKLIIERYRKSLAVSESTLFKAINGSNWRHA